MKIKRQISSLYFVKANEICDDDYDDDDDDDNGDDDDVDNDDNDDDEELMTEVQRASKFYKR